MGKLRYAMLAATFLSTLALPQWTRASDPRGGAGTMILAQAPNPNDPQNKGKAKQPPQQPKAVPQQPPGRGPPPPPPQAGTPPPPPPGRGGGGQANPQLGNQGTPPGQPKEFRKGPPQNPQLGNQGTPPGQFRGGRGQENPQLGNQGTPPGQPKEFRKGPPQNPQLGNQGTPPGQFRGGGGQVNPQLGNQGQPNGQPPGPPAGQPPGQQFRKGPPQNPQFGNQGQPGQGVPKGAPQGTPNGPPQGQQFGRGGPPPGGAGGPRFGNVDELRSVRQERVEGNRRVLVEPGNRFIIREGNRTFVTHDDRERFRRWDPNARFERRGAEQFTYFRRPGGYEVITVTDAQGRLLRRVRRGPDGRDIVLIDNRPRVGGASYFLSLPEPVIRVPRDRYIVDVEGAPPALLYDTLEAEPLVPIERAYSLDEVRYNAPLRDRLSRLDLNAITFETGSWEVMPEQADRLAQVAEAIQRVLERRPDEVFLIEGHTDAVGNDVDNLSLSDRRAEAVAAVLTENFQIPPENLTTQGYAAQFLKVQTEGPSRENRRVTIRRITPLLTGQR